MAKTTPIFNIDFRKEYPTLSQNINGVDVQLTESEYEATISEWELNQQKAKAEYELQIEKESKKQQILDRIGLTADEAKLLLG